ncbi:hypothetical protein VNO77_11353 [Canavalia gladiata]|uniref:Uncharacterized protein n=1 Tax=Canavalia gladiata TaxID=3824 RepID=A0AAN9QV89_CANGL
MGSSYPIQNEKSNAMRKLERKPSVEKMFHLFNVCATLFLFSHSSLFPITLQTLSLSHANALFAPLFHNSFYAFLFLNAIIFFLYALSNKNTNVHPSTDLYHEFLNRSTFRLSITASPAMLDSEVGESPSPIFEETVTVVPETTTTSCTTVTTTKVSEKKHYRRIQSERRMVVAPRREVKRITTNAGLNRQLQRRLCCVEQLSKDEFNRAVEEFIAKHKRMQWEEQVGSQKTEYLAITP